MDDLVGRIDALAELERVLDRLAADQGQLVLIGGEAGVGKTTLARAAARRGAERGLLVAAAVCAEASPGYWPWLQLIRRLRRGADPAAWDRAVTEAGPGLAALLGRPAGGGDDADGNDGSAPDGGGAGRGERFALFDGVTRLLAGLAADRPLLLVLEDLQLADPPSLQMLEFVARQTAFDPVLLLGTHRDEPPSEPGGLTVGATRIALAGLDHDEVGQLLRRVSGEQPDADTVAAVARRTGGNPFLIEQSARLAPDRPPPTSVTDLVAGRLAALSPAARTVLTAAAVAGLDVERSRLTDVLTSRDPDGSWTPDAVTAAIGSALAAGLLVAGEPGRVAFVHGLVGEHLGAGLSPERARYWHAAWAETGADRDDPGVVARHARAAVPEVEPARAAAWSVDAAGHAARRAAAAEAVDHLTGALELTAEDDPSRGTLLLELGTQLDLAGEMDRARTVVDRARRWARERRDAVLLAEAALSRHRLGNAGDDDHDTVAVLDEALATLPERAPARLRARVYAATATARAHRVVDDPAGARALAERAVEIARGAGPAELAWSLLARHDVDWAPGTAERRLALLDEVGRAARAGDAREPAALAAFLRTLALLELGDPATHQAFAEFASLTGLTGLPRHRYLLRSRRAMFALAAGRLDEAERRLEEAVRFGGRIGEHDAVPMHRDQLWTLHMHRGDHDRAAHVARTHLAGDPYNLLLEGISAAAAGDRRRARALHPEIEAMLPTMPGRFHAMTPVYLCSLAGVDDDPALHARARRAVDRWPGGWAVQSGGATLWGPLSYWAGRLAAAGGDTDTATTRLRQAVDQARALDAGHWVARAEAGLPPPPDGTGPEPATRPPGNEARPVFRREDRVWTLGYAGHTVRLPDAKGLQDLRVLLGRPGTDVPAADLIAGPGAPPAERAGARSGERPGERSEGADPVLDDTAREAYRRRLEQLDDAMTAALERGADGRAAQLDAERDALLDELRRATGLHGRSRRLGDQRERARQAVTARIRLSIRRIGTRHPALAEHLTGSIHTGTYCTYRPSEPVRWDLG